MSFILTKEGQLLEQNIALYQKQAQQLNLSQGLRQSLTILQLDVIDLTKYLEERSMENPLLEIKSNLDSLMSGSAESGAFQIADKHESLFHYVLEQIQLTMRPTELRKIVLGLVGYLDPSGYLLTSDQELKAALKIDDTHFRDALELLQQLDPPGIGARSLQECLVLQAERDAGKIPEMAVIFLEEHFEAILANKWQNIATVLKISSSNLAKIKRYIQNLSPTPSINFVPDKTPYIYPELSVEKNGTHLSLSLLNNGQPSIDFAQEIYQRLVQTNDRRTRAFLSEKKQEYTSIQQAIVTRRRTLFRISEIIVAHQYAYLTKKHTYLESLLLRDIAQRLQLNESTVSRAIKDKYIQTPLGIFSLKHFLSKRSNLRQDEHGASSDQVLKLLKDLISHENPSHPLSDEKIADLLQNESNIQIARRTVAKYRQKAGIASARQRKTQK